MKKYFLMICLVLFASSFCFAQSDNEEKEMEELIETSVGTDIWNIVMAPGESLPIGTFQLVDKEKNYIEIELFLGGSLGRFEYNSFEQMTNKTFKAYGKFYIDSNSSKPPREVALLFDLRELPEELTVTEFVGEDVLNIFYLNKMDSENYY